MDWFRKTTPKHAYQDLLDTAEQAFAAICQGDTYAAETYRVNPHIKERDWIAIREDLAALATASDESALPFRLRGRLTEMVELLVTDNFCARLDERDRALCAHLIDNDRETQGDSGGNRTTSDFAYASVLEFVIFNGWASDDLTVQHLATLQQIFIDHCVANCALQLTIAQAKARGQEISDLQKEACTAAILRKETARRAFAGEPVVASVERTET